MRNFMVVAFAIGMIVSSCKKEKKGLAAVNTSAASNVTATSAQTGGNITDDGGSAISRRGICWASHNNPTVGDSLTNDGTGGGNFNSSLSSLSSNTTYYIRAYAINASGTAYGQEISFKTSAGLATITTTAISSIVPLSAKSGGNITNDGGAAITARGVVWSTSPNPTINNSKSSDGTGTGTFTSTLSPLASQTPYYVRAYATNSYGTTYGNQVQFNAASANTVTDTEGNVYPYVTVCGKSWMSRNLKTTKYKNGDPITNGLSGFTWATSTTGAYTFPNGQESTKDTFGLLYSIYAINDTRGVCPTGWHVPSDDEWKAIEICQGMTQLEADGTGHRGTISAKFMEGGTSGLEIQKAGYFNMASGAYNNYNQYGLYWTSTSPNGISNYLRGFNVSNNPNSVYRTNNTWASSVRCVKD